VPADPPPADDDYLESMRACWRGSAHAKTLTGLMYGRGVRLLSIAGETNHGVPWSAIVAVGMPQADLLQQVAEAVAAKLDQDGAAARRRAAEN
jgi:hypothetical protein